MCFAQLSVKKGCYFSDKFLAVCSAVYVMFAYFSVCVAFRVKKEHIHTLPYRCTTKRKNVVSIQEHVLQNWKGGQ